MRILLVSTLAAILAGTATAAEKLVVPLPMTPAAIAAGTKILPVSLTRMAANIPPQKTWAEVGENPLCATEYTLEWKSQNNVIDPSSGFEQAFRDAFAQAKLRVGGDPTNLFNDDVGTANLQVGALITDVRARFCSMWTGEPYRGSLLMTVEWQIYSVSEAKVVARIRTEGGIEIKKPAKDAISRLIREGFGDNALRLAANEDFRRVIFESPAAAAAPLTAGAAAAVRFAPSKADSTPLSTAVNSVVTIRAGNGMGSGVLISADGYILTNHHVVGEAGTVRIRWSDGTENSGEVVRADRRRDVALVKASPKAGPLAIRSAPAQLGETVFAVGTPLRKEFSNTLTRGVVSGTRLLEGLPMIQSDVAVDHGNSGGPLLDEQGRIIALTVSGYEEGGVGRNINFFIPIADALKALALTPAT